MLSSPLAIVFSSTEEVTFSEGYSPSVFMTVLSVVGNVGNGLWRCNSLVDAPGSMQGASFVACVVAPGALRGGR